MRRCCASMLGSSSEQWLARQHKDPYVLQATADGWRARSVYKLIDVDRKFRLLGRRRSVVDLGCAPGGWTQYAVTKTIPRPDRRLTPAVVVARPEDSHQHEGADATNNSRHIHRPRRRRVGVWEVAGSTLSPLPAAPHPQQQFQDAHSTPPSPPFQQRPSGSSPVVIGVDIGRVAPIPGATLLQGDFTQGYVQSALRRLLPGGQTDVLLSDMAHGFTGHAATDGLMQMQLAEAAAEFAKHSLRRGGSMIVKVRVCGHEQAFLRDLQSWFKSAELFKPPASRQDSAETFIVARRRL